MKCASEGKDFGPLLQRTNCQHWQVFPLEDASLIPRIIEETQKFEPSELQRRFNAPAPEASYLSSIYSRAAYISAIWSETRQRLVGIGELYPGPDDQHEVAFLASESYSRSNAGLAHLLRRGLICKNMRHLVEMARDYFHARILTAYVDKDNDRAVNLMNRVGRDIGFFESEETRGLITYQAYLDFEVLSPLHAAMLNACNLLDEAPLNRVPLSGVRVPA